MKLPSEVTEKLPRPRFRASRSEKQKVLRLLDETSRLTFHPAEEVNPAFTNGLFGLVKNKDKDRLILDARCQNLRETATGAWIRNMASFTSLLTIQLLPGERLVFGGEDLRDFYYFFKIGRQRSLRNVLTGPVPEVVARQFTGFEGCKTGHARYFAALNTLAMGDRNAVSYGQTAHVALLLGTGQVSISELLTLDNCPSRGNFLTGICVDDLVTIEKTRASKPNANAESEGSNKFEHNLQVTLEKPRASRPKADAESEGLTTAAERSSSLLRAVRSSYEAVGLERNPDAASVCRSSSRRIGEAKNPGPAVGDLEAAALVGVRTQALQRRIVGEFFESTPSVLLR